MLEATDTTIGGPTEVEGEEIEENNGCVAINITGSCF